MAAEVEVKLGGVGDVRVYRGAGGDVATAPDLHTEQRSTQPNCICIALNPHYSLKGFQNRANIHDTQSTNV